MKKLSIILMTSTLFLGTSTSVQAASHWWFAGGLLGTIVYATEKDVEKRKKERLKKERQAKIKKIKNKARAALRQRAEAEYNHRHASHKWQ
jgi:hypothetical protein